jgi:hypothetical protein
LSEVWRLNFLRSFIYVYIIIPLSSGTNFLRLLDYQWFIIGFTILNRIKPTWCLRFNPTLSLSLSIMIIYYHYLLSSSSIYYLLLYMNIDNR